MQLVVTPIALNRAVPEFTQDMHVEGFTVSKEILNSAFDKLLERKAGFRFLDVQIDLMAAGLVHKLCDRTADRLLQSLRKQGFIEHNRNHDGLWSWVE
jgi:hypothetical protein